LATIYNLCYYNTKWTTIRARSIPILLAPK
jgi:hypothetical protein